MGTFLWLNHQKTIIRKQIKRNIIAGIDKDELVLLAFTIQETKTKLKWEHSKEFEYNNQMYDIVVSVNTGDSIYYWCWWDNEETVLNKQLKGVLKIALGHNEQNKEKRSHLNHFLKNLFNGNTLVQTLTPNWVYIQLYTDKGVIFSSLAHAPPTPPPQTV